MGFKRSVKRCLGRILGHYGHEIIPSSLVYTWQREMIDRSSRSSVLMSGEITRCLTPDNPYLVELRERYKKCDSRVTTPLVWEDGVVDQEEIAYFRGDSPWVWQVRGKNANILAYALSYYYLKSIDRLRLLDKFSEDNSFGNYTFQIDGRDISRDVLDSIAEIYFLDRHLQIGSRSGIRILDVGAGYGRLAYRMVSALPGIERYACTDAIAVSTFVNQYYLRFRDAKKAFSIPLDKIGDELTAHPVDLAINIHSFSECRLDAIEWWARLLSEHRIRYLMVVPNWNPARGQRLLTNDGQDFLPILQRCGYQPTVAEAKYGDPVVQEFGLYPSWYHLLELGGLGPQGR